MVDLDHFFLANAFVRTPLSRFSNLQSVISQERMLVPVPGRHAEVERHLCDDDATCSEPASALLVYSSTCRSASAVELDLGRA